MDEQKPVVADTTRQFGFRLCRVMALRKISVQRLSTRTGIARSHLSQYRSGVKEPMLFNLVKLCKALPVSADYLCGLESDCE